MSRAILVVIVTLSTALPNVAAEELPSADRRFAVAEITETPSFQRHVLPLMGRLGCNGRACHGSFQGQGGFRLSLFGYDFKADHDALLAGDAPRIDLKNPAASLMLKKPTLGVAHKGGKRVEVDSWQYRLLFNWAKAGAPAVKDTDAEFASLEVEPREIVFGKAGEKVRLKVTARWSDGTREDVTPLCRFRSNDEATATADASGEITAVTPGDTDVVAFYDNGVVPAQIILPVSDRVGAKYPAVPTPTKIDELAVAKLRKLGSVPSDLSTDEEFLRRVSLDMTGTLPTATEIIAFKADSSADKRTKKIDELLERPAYAAWWTTKIGDFTGNSERNGPLGGEQRLNQEKSRQWYLWVNRRVRENVPYDQLVEGIVLALGRQPGQTYEAYCAEMSGYFRKDDPADFTARKTMPYFWTRRPLGQPGEKALAFAHAFLGVSLQCAQCHKHPYDQWTKQDFDQFTAFFGGIRYGGGDRKIAKDMMKDTPLAGLDEDSGNYKTLFVKFLSEGKTLPFKDLSVPARAKPANPNVKPGGKSPAGRVLTPRLLGGDEVIASNYDDPRQPLMDWMRTADNPYFAKAFVNRVWATYFNVGLIDPPDDLSLANPPSNPALLDYLCHEFIARKYDMKWLHRTIANSRTYQLSWRPNETNKHDERNFSRAVLRRLPAEVAYDAIYFATASDDGQRTLRDDPVSSRAIGVVSGYSGGRIDGAYAVNLFGKPPRAINCDCERSDEPALLQTVYLRNDQELLAMLDRPDGWVRQVTGGPGKAPKRKQLDPVPTKPADPNDLIREAYLRTVSRLPDERETAIARKHLSEAATSAAGLRDLLWALINTKEFILNR